MPYPGIPEEKTGAMERCVASVMKEQGLEKSRAIAICHTSIMGGIVLEPVTQADLTEYGNHALLASGELGEMLKFRGALLCQAGTNKNGDSIDESGIEELAATMSFLPLDDEHNQTKIIGFLVHPRAEGDKLYTDGVLYSRRFPKIVAQVQSGEKKLSVEAVAQTAICSICGGEFSSIRDYCEHLMDKSAHGAVRKLYGLKAKGGATVFRPAWDTSFDANGFVMIASQLSLPKTDAERAKTHFKISDEDWDKLSDKEKQAHISKLPPVGTKRANESQGALWARIESKLDALLQRFKPVPLENDQTKGGVQMSEVNVDELNLEELGLVRASELDTLKADLEAKLAEKDTDAKKLKIGFARVLEMGMEASQLEILADMSEDAYQLLKAQREETSEEETEEETTVQAGEETTEETQTQTTVLEGGDTTTVAPLTWETAGSVLKLKKEV